MIKKLIPSIIKQQIKLALHAGNECECPICGFESKDFFPIGIDLPVQREKEIVGGGLRNGGCYKCDSIDRERLIFTFLKNKLKVFENKSLKILHFAPEKNISRILNETGFERYECGDLFTEGYEYPDYVQHMNVLDIPFEDNSFDLVICNHLLEHIPNDIDAMKELYRVLKTEGKAILQVPFSLNSETTFENDLITDPKERETVFGQFDHLRIYGHDYVDRLNSVGFKVEQSNISSEYPKYGLNLKEDIFVGVK